MRSESDSKLVDQRVCSAKAAFCSATATEIRNQRSEIRNSCSARAPSRTREARMLPHSIGRP